MNFDKYEVVPSRIYQHNDGRTASIYGAVPLWAHDSTRGTDWDVVQVGWTVRNPRTGQVGIGRPPCATQAEAQALADRLGAPSALGLGD